MKKNKRKKKKKKKKEIKLLTSSEVSPLCSPMSRRPGSLGEMDHVNDLSRKGG
eukprot:CAMPEP_0194752798 /NCGR_PEP_ID=MMETSP0323_2-20130528/6691_1 /TAXON_ID=2866 ORGANISM="Crypthecodinium cohnii, Strain Seligo" /NCGR_SAMPLE_ID=MMETSP0323_2 /ASSEMBLY_ACC=CAM_ASM_000346 /LENGTH=52 /DNA_ID=CAMNT_0039670099 /DNA_START=277 /DNA_END=431 /DNA_ORIENTATION=+